MNTLIRSEFVPRFGSLLENFFGNQLTPFVQSEWFQTVPAVNITENDESFTIEVAAPGLSKEDFKLHLDNDILKIRVQKERQSESKDERYTRKEFNFTSFERSFNLPRTIDSEQITATYQDGLMKINLPKKPEARPKTPRVIDIQ